MEAQAEVERDRAQPAVVARAQALRRELAVQPEATGRSQAARVALIESQARSDARRASLSAAPR